MMAFPQLASLGTAVSLLSCCLGLAAQTTPAEQPSPWQVTATLAEGINTNVLMALQKPHADSTSSLQLDLGRSWRGPTWSFIATYHPQAMDFARNRRLDYIAQTYNQAWQLSLGPHTQMSWTFDFNRYPERGGAPQAAGGGVAGVAIASQALGLQSVLQSADTTVSLTHQYSLRGSWNAGITGAQQSFTPDLRLLGSLPAGTLAPPRSRTSSGAGNLGWDYELVPGRRLRLSGEDSELWFSNPAQRMRYDYVQASISQDLGAGVVLQIGAGPSWNSVLQSAALQKQLPGVSYAGNASLITQQGNTTYGITWQHSEQAGLVPGGVATDNVAMQYGLTWGRGWNASASLGEGRFAGVSSTPGTASQGQDSVFAAANLGWKISSGWMLVANANWMSQTLPVAPGTLGRFRKLQASLGVSYTPEGLH